MALDEIVSNDKNLASWVTKTNLALADESLPLIDGSDKNLESYFNKMNALIASRGQSLIINGDNFANILTKVNLSISDINGDVQAIIDFLSFSYPDITTYSSSADLSFSEEFVPGVSGSASANTPLVANYNKTAFNGDTITVAGQDFTALSGDDYGKDTQILIFTQVGSTQYLSNGDILRITDDTISFTIPSSLPADNLYMVWIKNDNGYGSPIFINQAEIWWNKESLYIGDTLEVFGKNLKIGSTNPRLYIVEEDQWIIAETSSNSYKADFIIPSLTNGSYTIKFHNGYGQEYGWSEDELSITIVSEIQWTGTTFDVTAAPYNAVGDGIADDLAAIQSAISAALSVDYSTVYFPAGTYNVSTKFGSRYADKIRYLGDGMDQTIIRPHSTFSEGNDQLTEGRDYDKCQVENLTLQSRGDDGDRIAYFRGSSNCVFKNMRLDHRNANNANTAFGPFDLEQTTNITVEDCEFYLCGYVAPKNCEQIFIKNTDFYGLYDNNTFIQYWAGHGLSVTGCNFRNYDNSDSGSSFGWAKGRCLSGSGVWGPSTDVYFGSNNTYDFTPRIGADQNSGEVVMFEGENPKWYGNVASSTVNTITLTGIGSDASRVGDSCTIIDGKGIGQNRIITDVTSDVVTVDKDWTISPDTSSVICINTCARRIVVYDNYTRGTDRAVTQAGHTACTGAQPYGGGFDWIVANNTFWKMREGMSLHTIFKEADNISEGVAMPLYFMEVLDNTLINCRKNIQLLPYISGAGGAFASVKHVGILGILFRNNTTSLTEDKMLDINSENEYSLIKACVFDTNIMETTNDSIVAYNYTLDGVKDIVFIGNSFTGNNTQPGITNIPGHIPVFKNNTWTDFTSDYTGTLPGGVLEAPNRVVYLWDANTSSENGSFEIFNAGTSSLSWTASTSDGWITVNDTSGSINPDGDSDTITFTIDPSGLGSGTNDGTIEVAGNSYTKRITISYTKS